MAHLSFGNVKDERTCSLSCEIKYDFVAGKSVSVVEAAQVYKFSSPESLTIIKAGHDIFLIKTMQISPAFHTEQFGTPGFELCLNCSKQGNEVTALQIIIPIATGTPSNTNGETLYNLIAGMEVPSAKFAKLIPKDTGYITYMNNVGGVGGVETERIILTESNIIMESVSPTTVRISPLVAGTVSNVAKNKVGIKEKGNDDNKIETIECLPINDDGILLTDIEKGLGDSNPASGFNFSEMLTTALKNPGLRLFGGALSVVILYKIISMLRYKKTAGLKTMKEINKT